MAPIFVGSENENSRVRSDRLGFAASTSDPGSAAEGDGYYNSTDNQLKFYDGSSWSAIQGSGSVELVASGTLANGQTVIVTSDGKVAGVATVAISQSLGTPAVFESASTDRIATTFDSSNNKVIIAYRDKGNSNRGTAIVGTISGTSISFGSPVVWESGEAEPILAVYDSTNQKVVIVYRDYNNSYYGTAIVGTVSGTSISFGSSAVFASASVSDLAATYDSTNNKVVVAYKDGSNSDYGTAVVGTVSGTSISFGSAVIFEYAGTYRTSATFDSSNGKVVIAYQDAGNNGYGTAIVGTVSGTSISFGSPTVFASNYIGLQISAVYDSSNGKVVIAYQGASDYGRVRVASVSGTSISFGDEVVFNSALTYHISATFDSSNGKVVIAYQDWGNNYYGTVILGTVSGTSISFGTPVVFASSDSEMISVVHDFTNNKVAIAYQDDGNSEYGNAVVFSPATTTTNLTTENFIGFSDAAYSDGDTATVQVVTALDDAQSGLTTGSKHYVQNDGTLSTTAGSPSVLAGTAISDTEIIVKQ